jgi:hypothetical protein
VPRYCSTSSSLAICTTAHRPPPANHPYSLREILGRIRNPINLDTGSTHNFIQGASLQKLGLAAAAGDQLRVTVANGDRLRCVGVARDVPVTIAGEQYHITCVGIDLGCFDFILGVDFLRTLGPIT